MNILFMGTPEFAVPSLRALVEQGHRVLEVWTQPDKPQGRKMKLTPPPVKLAAQQMGIPVRQPETLKDRCMYEPLQALSPELIVVVAYGKLLPEYVLSCPPQGCINVHGSLLPRYRGAGPIQWSVINGEKIAGVTTMYMAQELDAGDMLLSRAVEVGEDETAGELYERLKAVGAQVLIETIEAIQSGEIQATPQDPKQATYAPMLSREKAGIDWRNSDYAIHNQVRGMNPWPIAQTIWQGESMKIIRTRRVGLVTAQPPGTIVQAQAKKGLLVATGNGRALEICTLQPKGGKVMDAKSYLLGHAMAEGARFG